MNKIVILLAKNIFSMEKLSFICILVFYAFIINPVKSEKIWDQAKLLNIETSIEQKTSEVTNISTTSRYYYGSSSSNTFINSNPVTVNWEYYFFTILHQGLIYKTQYIKYPVGYIRPLLIKGDPIEIRFNKDSTKIYIKNRNGKEFTTSIIEVKKTY